jgi:hypothetical protein
LPEIRESGIIDQIEGTDGIRITGPHPKNLAADPPDFFCTKMVNKCSLYMLDEYTRQRFDRIADDVAVTRARAMPASSKTRTALLTPLRPG